MISFVYINKKNLLVFNILKGIMIPQQIPPRGKQMWDILNYNQLFVLLYLPEFTFINNGKYQ